MEPLVVVTPSVDSAPIGENSEKVVVSDNDPNTVSALFLAVNFVTMGFGVDG